MQEITNLKNFTGVLFILLLSSFAVNAEGMHVAKKQVKLMGCSFEITAVANSDQNAWNAVNEGITEISRIEKLISSWNDESQTSEINRSAGIKAVIVEQELFQLIYRSKKVSELTKGAFDISFASMDRIWQFNGMEQELPSAEKVDLAHAKISWENILLNPDDHSVFLKESGMKIGFGGIGKGYAANRAKEIMSHMQGVQGGLVNASGDLIAWGLNGDSDHWKIQIADPKNNMKSLGWLALKDMAIVTSGDYEKFFTVEGQRYAHIINPKTGYPTTGIKSVSVICPDAEIADALATSIFVLGKKEGLKLINQMNQIECFIIDDQDQVSTSDTLKLNYY